MINTQAMDIVFFPHGSIFFPYSVSGAGLAKPVFVCQDCTFFSLSLDRRGIDELVSVGLLCCTTISIITEKKREGTGVVRR